MLTEIRCEAFGESKHIHFFSGLNIVQGHSGNSIGKSSFLIIIDFAFGGDYYAESNEDILRNIGDHNICFVHTFESNNYYFTRNAKSSRKVFFCDHSFKPESEMLVDDFCKWLLSKYELDNRNSTWRHLVGLYLRIWNKPNKEVDRPLYYYDAQTVESAITDLIKLFNEYSSISEFDEMHQYLKKRESAWRTAASYHIVEFPSTKKAYMQLKSESRELDEKIQQLKRNLSVVAIESSEKFNDNVNNAYELRRELVAQQGRYLRDKRRAEKNLNDIHVIGKAEFSQLSEFFPGVNIERINEVQGFHISIRNILKSEFEREIANIELKLSELQSKIEQNDKDIQALTGLPTQTNDIMASLLQTFKTQESIQTRMALYEEKTADTIQKGENKDKLGEILGRITSSIGDRINDQIKLFSAAIDTGNSKAPSLKLSSNNYEYGVKDNTGTGKAYTDLILFDLAILYLTDLPILIHDSFLFNNIDDKTIQSFILLYNKFVNKQIFISLDSYISSENEEFNNIIFSSTRLLLSENKMLFGKDWRM